jgi:acetyl esterase/lipase
MASPRPPRANFKRRVKTTISPTKGHFNLEFYTPKHYHAHKSLKGKPFPVVVNFHGGGFTLGTAHDDARWAKTVVDEVGAVVVSVNYRLAPEHPFPTAVEDGVDALLYLVQHARSLMLDPDRFAVSGFSSGANMSFTVPLRLQSEVLDNLTGISSLPTASSSSAFLSPDVAYNINGSGKPLEIPLSEITTNTSSTLALPGAVSLNPSSASLLSTQKDGATIDIRPIARELKLRGIVAFYPSTDYTQTRAQRRMTCIRADQDLPAVFTELFDESYLQPPSLDKSSPYLSPGVAPAHMLAALPDDIALFTCEWDMLLAEGERLRKRLTDEMGKNVMYRMVPGVPHGWDKAPNPLRESPGAREEYMRACAELKRMLA